MMDKHLLPGTTMADGLYDHCSCTDHYKLLGGKKIQTSYRFQEGNLVFEVCLKCRKPVEEPIKA